MKVMHTTMSLGLPATIFFDDISIPSDKLLGFVSHMPMDEIDEVVTKLKAGAVRPSAFYPIAQKWDEIERGTLVREA